MSHTSDRLLLTNQPDTSRIDSSSQRGAPISRTTLWLASGSVIGSLLFTTIYLIEGATRPGYNALQQPVSALSLGPGGWVQQVNFIVFGVLALFAAVGWRKILQGGRGAIGYPIMRGLEGLSLIIIGIFSQDPNSGYPVGATLTAPTTHAMIHLIFSSMTIVAMAVGSFILAWRLIVEPRWHGWAPFLVLGGILTIVFITLYGAQGAHYGLAGLFERLSGSVNIPVGILLLARLWTGTGFVASKK